MGYVFSSMLFLFLSLFPSVLMSTLLLRAEQTTAKEKRCPAARRRHLRPQGAVLAGAAERPPGPACALHPGGGRRAAGSSPPGRLHGAGGRSRLPPTVLGQRSSQRGPDAIVCARGDEARHVFPSPWIELSPPQHGFPECGPLFNSSVSRGRQGTRERGPPLRARPALPKAVAPTPSGALGHVFGSLAGAAGWAHGPEDTSQTKASRAAPAAQCRSGRLGPRPTPRRHASPSDKRAQAGGTGGAVCACVCACEPATSTVWLRGARPPWLWENRGEGFLCNQKPPRDQQG